MNAYGTTFSNNDGSKQVIALFIHCTQLIPKICNNIEKSTT